MATFDRLIAANVRAPYFLVAALLPNMAVRGSGSIINIASMLARSAWPAAPPRPPLRQCPCPGRPIFGMQDAILVDPPFTRTQIQRVADWSRR